MHLCTQAKRSMSPNGSHAPPRRGPRACGPALASEASARRVFIVRSPRKPTCAHHCALLPLSVCSPCESDEDPDSSCLLPSRFLLEEIAIGVPGASSSHALTEAKRHEVSFVCRGVHCELKDLSMQRRSLGGLLCQRLLQFRHGLCQQNV